MTKNYCFYFIFYIFASDFFYNIIHKTNKYNIGVLNNRNTLNYTININRN